MFGERIRHVGPQHRAIAAMHSRTFERSPEQQQAFNQLVTDAITAPCQKVGAAPIDIPPFLMSVLQSFAVYGYALFRHRAGPGSLPEVADGSLYFIRRTARGWKPCAYEGANPLRGTRGWHLAVFEEPRIEMRLLPGKGGAFWMTMSPASCAQRSTLHALSINEMELHRRQRNLYNSQPTVFMSEPVEAKPSEAQPAWQSLYAQPAAATGAAWALEPVGQQSLQQMLGSRLQASRLLRHHDSAVISDQITSGNAVGSLESVPGGLEPPRAANKQAHAELILSTGMSATPSRHLEGDHHEHATARDLSFSVFDAYRVPPGKFGMNRNTERMAGNLLISQQPIYIYSRWVERIITMLNAVLLVVGCPEIRSVPDPAFVQLISGVLTVDAAARIYSETYNIDLKDIDPERLAAMMAVDDESHVKKSTSDLAASKVDPKHSR